MSRTPQSLAAKAAANKNAVENTGEGGTSIHNRVIATRSMSPGQYCTDCDGVGILEVQTTHGDFGTIQFAQQPGIFMSL